MVAWRSVILLAVLAALSPYLYDLTRLLRPLVFNKPENLPKIADFTSHEVLFADHVRNCEDVILVEEKGVAILSCSPGRDKWNTVMGQYIDDSEHGCLYIYNYASTPTEPPKRITLTGFNIPFHPLGLAYHAESRTLAIANHGGSSASIALFSLDLSSSKPSEAIYLKSITHPLLPTPNSIAFLNASHIYVSNTHTTATLTKPTTLLQKARVWVATLEHRLSLPTGSVALVDTATGSATKLLNLPFANGVELLDDGKTLAVASTTRAAVYFYSIGETGDKVAYKRRTAVPFLPDNISVDGKGNLLVAGHPHAASLGRMARDNWKCNHVTAEKDECFRAPSWVVELKHPASQNDEVRHLYVDSAFGSSSTGVADVDRGLTIISGLYERGLLIARR